MNTIIKRTRALGDCLMLTPVIREYKRRNPDEDIYIETEYNNVFENNPNVKKYKTQQFSKLYNLDGCYEKNFNIHPIDMFGVKLLGDDNFDKSIEFNYTEKEKNEVDEWIKNKSKRSKVIMHLGMTWAKLNKEVVNSFIKWLLDRYFLIIVGGGHSDEYYPYTIINDNLVYLSKWSLGKLKYLMDISYFFFGTDSGVSHIASSSNIPQIVIYGAINPETRKPFRDKIFIPIVGKCENQFCAERNKKMLGNGECHGIICTEQYKCTMNIKFEQIIEKVEKV